MIALYARTSPEDVLTRVGRKLLGRNCFHGICYFAYSRGISL